jgi:hemoglobin-like flavoprotein
MMPGTDAAGPGDESRVTPVARLDQRSIDLVRRSVDGLRGQERHMADLFYGHLFRMVPEARRLFPADMSDQHLRLLEALLLAVDGLDDPAAMEARLLSLGEDQFARGVEERHLQYVAHALVRAVRELQPAEWSSSLSSAWIGLYSWMIGHMVAGFRRAGLRASSGPSAGASPVPPPGAPVRP